MADITDTIRDSLISIGRSDAAAARLEEPIITASLHRSSVIRYAWLTHFLGKATRAADEGTLATADIWFSAENQAELAIVERELGIGDDFTRKGAILRERVAPASKAIEAREAK